MSVPGDNSSKKAKEKGKKKEEEKEKQKGKLLEQREQGILDYFLVPLKKNKVSMFAFRGPMLRE